MSSNVQLLHNAHIIALCFDSGQQQQLPKCYAKVSSLTLEVSVTCNIPYNGNVTPVVECKRVFNEEMQIVPQEKDTRSFRKELRNNDNTTAVKCYLYFSTPESMASPHAIEIPVKVNVIRPVDSGE
jgi:hypothetical protein